MSTNFIELKAFLTSRVTKTQTLLFLLLPRHAFCGAFNISRITSIIDLPSRKSYWFSASHLTASTAVRSLARMSYSGAFGEQSSRHSGIYDDLYLFRAVTTSAVFILNWKFQPEGRCWTYSVAHMGTSLLRLWSPQLLLHLNLVLFGWPSTWPPHAVLPLWMVVHAPLILYVPIKLYQQFFPAPTFSLLDSFIEGLLCRLVCLDCKEKSWSSVCAEEFSP